MSTISCTFCGWEGPKEERLKNQHCPKCQSPTTKDQLQLLLNIEPIKPEKKIIIGLNQILQAPCTKRYRKSLR